MSQDNRPKSAKDQIPGFEELRRKRADGAAKIRKARKDEVLMKKRDIDLTAEDLNVTDPADAAKIDKCLLQWESGHFDESCSTAKMAHFMLRATNYNSEVIHRMANCLPLLDRLTETLRNENDDSKQEAAKVFDSIIAEDTAYIANVEGVGAIDIMIQVIEHTADAIVARYCVSVLGNYMVDNSTRHISLLQRRIVPSLVGLLKRFKSELRVMSTLSWAIANVCRDPKTVNNYSSAVYDCLFAIEYLILMDDENILDRCCSALELLTGEKCFTDTNGVDRVLQSGVVARLILLLEHSSRRIAERSLNAVGNILYSGEEQTQVLINLGVIPPLLRLLKSNDREMVAESLWSLSNISAGTTEQIHELVEAGVIPEAVRILKESLPVSTRKEASWILTHIARTENVETIKKLHFHGTLQALSYVLSTVSRDPSTVMVAMRGLRRLLQRAQEAGQDDLDLFTLTIEQFGGKQFIEDYLIHPNKDISDYAACLIDYWA